MVIEILCNVAMASTIYPPAVNQITIDLFAAQLDQSSESTPNLWVKSIVQKTSTNCSINMDAKYTTNGQQNAYIIEDYAENSLADDLFSLVLFLECYTSTCAFKRYLHAVACFFYFIDFR